MDPDAVPERIEASFHFSYHAYRRSPHASPITEAASVVTVRTPKRAAANAMKSSGNKMKEMSAAFTLQTATGKA
jgi:hypothetical protein